MWVGATVEYAVDGCVKRGFIVCAGFVGGYVNV